MTADADADAGSSSGTGTVRRWAPAAAGCVLLLAAALLAPHEARAAAAQDWPPFVLVAGLLLVGLVADEDRLFAAGGHALARLAPNGLLLYVGSAVLVVLVTTLLNLDTSVTFLTPVLVYAGRSRSRGRGESQVAPLLYACLLLSNAGSLLLPGSNLTNLIVLGHLHLSGRDFLDHMALPALAAAAVTAVVVGAVHHRALRTTIVSTTEPERPVLGVGLVAIGIVTVLVVALRAPALPVGAVGVVAVLVRAAGRSGDEGSTAGARDRGRAALQVLGVPVLVGLFGLAVALGTLGRSWSGPATLLSHLDAWGTAAFAAVTSVLVNNLPAASLLAARQPPHPFALLIGLNVGPNLFVTGSLAWILWLRAAKSAGGRPDVRRASLLGVASVPLAIAAAVGVLVLSGAS
jgi:arsenical pump membrane protein